MDQATRNQATNRTNNKRRRALELDQAATAYEAHEAQRLKLTDALDVLPDAEQELGAAPGMQTGVAMATPQSANGTTGCVTADTAATRGTAVGVSVSATGTGMGGPTAPLPVGEVATDTVCASLAMYKRERPLE